MKDDGETINEETFEMVVADWGTSWVGNYQRENRFYGGTPVYAGPRTFERANKDMFSFGRLALELMCGNYSTDKQNKQGLPRGPCRPN